MADRETLAADLKDLHGQLQPLFEADKARVEAEGRPFDAAGWWAGKVDSGKYPAGPAYWVRLVEPVDYVGAGAGGHLMRKMRGSCATNGTPCPTRR
jgi:hypothetical protein